MDRNIQKGRKPAPECRKLESYPQRMAGSHFDVAQRRPQKKKPSQHLLARPLTHLMSNAAGAIYRHDAHTLTHPENLILFDRLNVSAHAAVIFIHGNFNTLGAG